MAGPIRKPLPLPPSCTIMDDQHSTGSYDHLLKILLIGDQGSNKRALLKNYIGDEDMSDTTTLGEGFRIVIAPSPPLHG